MCLRTAKSSALLIFSENTGSFIEEAAIGKVADMFDSKDKNLQIGGCLNHYRALAHRIYAQYLLGRGRFDEAIAESKTAVDLEPTSHHNQEVIGSMLYFARRFDEAAA